MDARNLALIGFMAAGKTTIGRAVATRLGYAYVDTDDLIRQQAGCAIPAIFAGEGEAGFRRREREAVAAAATRTATVIACGGGVARDPANVEVLRTRACIIWLRIGAETATGRILASGAGRPMIDEHVAERTHEHVLARVGQLLGERNPYYAAAAEVVVDVDGHSIDDVVEAVLDAVAAA